MPCVVLRDCDRPPRRVSVVACTTAICVPMPQQLMQQQQRLASACANTSFVTLVTGSRYAVAAACLPRQMQMVDSACPILLVYDDADDLLPVSLLRSSYGEKNMIPLSHLKRRYSNWHNTMSIDSGVMNRRRLYGTTETHNTHQKLWLWALPMKTAVFLDIDMLVLRNIDSLLDVRFNESAIRDEVGAVTCKSKYGDRYFNSGLMVLQPSLHVLKKLLVIDRWASPPWNGHIPHGNEKWPDICSPANDPEAASREFPNVSNPLAACRNKYGPGRQPGMMSKACESKLTDQSIFNHVFTRHLGLPHSFNDAAHFRIDVSHIVHFVGEPKPWSHSRSRRGLEPMRANATREWQRRCAPLIASHGNLTML